MARNADTHQDVLHRILGGTMASFERLQHPPSLSMSVSTTSTFLFEVNRSRYRDMEPFPPNQGIKPTAPLQKQLSVFATDPARGLSRSR